MYDKNKVTDKVNERVEKLTYEKSKIDEELALLGSIEVANGMLSPDTRTALLEDLFKFYKNIYGNLN